MNEKTISYGKRVMRKMTIMKPVIEMTKKRVKKK